MQATSGRAGASPCRRAPDPCLSACEGGKTPGGRGEPFGGRQQESRAAHLAHCCTDSSRCWRGKIYAKMSPSRALTFHQETKVTFYLNICTNQKLVCAGEKSNRNIVSTATQLEVQNRATLYSCHPAPCSGFSPIFFICR